MTNDSSEVATSTCAWPGIAAWFGAMHGTPAVIAAMQPEPSRLMYLATFAARSGTPK